MKGRKVLVFGLARSGVGAANLLSALGADVTVTDRKTGEELGEYLEKLSPVVRLKLGGHPETMNGTDLVVVSPGVPLDIMELKEAREKGIPVVGELELAYAITAGRPGPSPAFLAVTGTNGKSTTTTLLDLMLRSSGFRTIIGGNIGTALTEELLPLLKGPGPFQAPDLIVVEVSSFQLEAIETFRPKGAVILNITPDHLDRYRSMEEYRDAKARIFLNQGSGDFLVLNADDPETRSLVPPQDAGRSVYFFSREREVEGVFASGGTVKYRLGNRSGELIRPEEIRIRGVHNLENAMAASAMALLAGCDPYPIAGVLREFPGLEHRMEFVRELDGVQYINDSKGTNVGAVLKSLDGFPEPVILIAGGRDKAGDFRQLRPLVRDRVKRLILIGEASGKIKGALGDIVTTDLARDLNEAVEIARKSAVPGDVVLLSPACASFDMFRDFEDRGRRFKEIVTGLAG